MIQMLEAKLMLQDQGQNFGLETKDYINSTQFSEIYRNKNKWHLFTDMVYIVYLVLTSHLGSKT